MNERCDHDWRDTIFGIRCELCARVVSLSWLLDELSDAEADRDAERARADRAEAVIRDLRGEGTERHEYADALIVVAQIFAHQHGGESATTMTVRRAAGALRTADRRLAAAIRERDEARAAADRLEMERDGLRRSYERARREALEEAAVIAREHGAISAYYALRALAAEVDDV